MAVVVAVQTEVDKHRRQVDLVAVALEMEHQKLAQQVIPLQQFHHKVTMVEMVKEKVAAVAVDHQLLVGIPI
jgi:hypothetical protein